MSGLPAVAMGMIAAVFYGIALGGWLIVGTLGALLSICTHLISLDNGTRKKLSRLMSVITAAIGCLFLATLDWYIGPF